MQIQQKEFGFVETKFIFLLETRPNLSCQDRPNNIVSFVYDLIHMTHEGPIVTRFKYSFFERRHTYMSLRLI